MARSSNVSIMMKVRGGRNAAREMRKVRREAEELGLRGAKGLANFAARADRLKSFGKNMTTRVTLPMAAAGVAAFKMSADFDDSMNKIVGLVGVSREQVNAWKDDVLGLSKLTGIAPKELADGLFFATSAGLRGKTAMEALTASAKAADAGLGNTATVIDAVTSAMNAYGPENLSAARATDILTAAVREGKMEADALAPVIGSVLPVAESMKVGFEQVAGAMALMSKSGTNPARAATQLTAILGTFDKPTKKMTAGLESMGLTLDGVRKSLANKGLVPTLDDLTRKAKEAGIDLSEVFGNKRALTGVRQLTRDLGETDSVMEGVANSVGLTDKAFEEAQKTAKDKLDDAMNAVKVTAIQLGAAIGPTLVPMIEKFSSVVGSLATDFGDLSPTMRYALIGTVLFAGALGPLSWILGVVATASGRLAKAMIFLSKTKRRVAGSTALLRVQLAGLWVQQKISAGFAALQARAMLGLRIQLAALWVQQKLAAAGQWLLNFAMAAFPVFAIVLGVIALGAAFVYAYQKVDWFRKGVDTAFSFVKNHWRWLLVPISPIIAPILMIVKHFGKIRSGAASAFGWAKRSGERFIGFITSMPGRIAKGASSMFDGIKSAFRNAMNFVIGKWNSLELSLELPGILKKLPGAPDRVTIGTPNIPMLAQGGFMSGYGSAVVGDAGAELLTLSPQGAAVEPLAGAPAAALSGGGSGGGRVVHEHHWYIDGREITKSVAHQLRVREANA